MHRLLVLSLIGIVAATAAEQATLERYRLPDGSIVLGVLDPAKRTLKVMYRTSQRLEVKQDQAVAEGLVTVSPHVAGEPLQVVARPHPALARPHPALARPLPAAKAALTDEIALIESLVGDQQATMAHLDWARADRDKAQAQAELRRSRLETDRAIDREMMETAKDDARLQAARERLAATDRHLAAVAAELAVLTARQPLLAQAAQARLEELQALQQRLTSLRQAASSAP